MSVIKGELHNQRSNRVNIEFVREELETYSNGELQEMYGRVEIAKWYFHITDDRATEDTGKLLDKLRTRLGCPEPINTPMYYVVRVDRDAPIDELKAVADEVADFVSFGSAQLLNVVYSDNPYWYVILHVEKDSDELDLSRLCRIGVSIIDKFQDLTTVNDRFWRKGCTVSRILGQNIYAVFGLKESDLAGSLFILTHKQWADEEEQQQMLAYVQKLVGTGFVTAHGSAYVDKSGNMFVIVKVHDDCVAKLLPDACDRNGVFCKHFSNIEDARKYLTERYCDIVTASFEQQSEGVYMISIPRSQELLSKQAVAELLTTFVQCGDIVLNPTSYINDEELLFAIEPTSSKSAQLFDKLDEVGILSVMKYQNMIAAGVHYKSNGYTSVNTQYALAFSHALRTDDKDRADEVKWCREHAPKSIKDATDDELIDCMHSAYIAFGSVT